jgi:hypothetical protein
LEELTKVVVQALQLLPAYELLLGRVSQGVIPLQASCGGEQLNTHVRSAHHGAIEVGEFLLASVYRVLSPEHQQLSLPSDDSGGTVWIGIGLFSEGKLPGVLPRGARWAQQLLPPAVIATNYETVAGCLRSAVVPGEPNSQLWVGIGLESAVGEGVVTEPQKQDTGSAPLSTTETGLTAIERAMLILMRDPNQSNRAIAGKVGCHPSLLSKGERFKRLRKAMIAILPKGSKTREGDLEASTED